MLRPDMITNPIHRHTFCSQHVAVESQRSPVRSAEPYEWRRKTNLVVIRRTRHEQHQMRTITKRVGELACSHREHAKTWPHPRVYSSSGATYYMSYYIALNSTQISEISRSKIDVVRTKGSSRIGKGVAYQTKLPDTSTTLYENRSSINS